MTNDTNTIKYEYADSIITVKRYFNHHSNINHILKKIFLEQQNKSIYNVANKCYNNGDTTVVGIIKEKKNDQTAVI